MKRSDVSCLAEMAPQERALQMLKLGAELGARPRKPVRYGALPMPLRRETIQAEVVGPVLNQLHGAVGATVEAVTGLSDTGRTLATDLGPVADLVLTPRQRKRSARVAMRAAGDRSVQDLAIRQLGLGLLDSTPVARCCAAYAYWQATQADATVIPVLESALQSKDLEESTVAAHCLAKIDPKKHVAEALGYRRFDPSR